jgi:hypothetical protein
MLGRVDCPQCGEFRTAGHVCPEPLPMPCTVGEVTRMVFEALHPEEQEETIYDRHPLPLEGSAFFGPSTVVK